MVATLIDAKTMTSVSTARKLLKTSIVIIVNRRNVRIEESGQVGWLVQASSRKHLNDISIKKRMCCVATVTSIVDCDKA